MFLLSFLRSVKESDRDTFVDNFMVGWLKFHFLKGVDDFMFAACFFLFVEFYKLTKSK